MNIKAVRRLVLVAAATGAAFAAAQASAQPVRRPGLWDTQVTAMGVDMHMQMCVGVEKPGDASAFTSGGPGGRGMDRGRCGGGPQIASTPGGMTYHITCHPSPQMTMESTGTVTGDFNSDYTIHAVTTMTPAFHGMGPMETTVVAHYAGQCPAGMSPGDRSINGHVLHRPD